MRRTASALLACLLLAAPAQAQKVTLPAEVKAGVGAWVIVAPESLEGGKPKWRADPGLQEVRLDLLLPPETLAQLKGKVYTSPTAGRFRVEAWNAKGDVASEISTCWVVVGEPAPPVPPVPPGPTKVKVPSVVGQDWLAASVAVRAAGLVPVVVGDQAKAVTSQSPAGGELVDAGSTVTLTTSAVPPVPATGLRVILIYESEDNLSRQQQLTIYGKQVEAYLNRKCKDGAKGWKRWDKDVNVVNETQVWKDLWAATKPQVTTLPAVLIVTDQSGKVYPLPPTEAALLQLLKQTGGE